MRQRLLQGRFAVLRHFVVPGLALMLGIGGAFAQSGAPQNADQSGKSAAAAAEAAKENQRKTDEFAEAAHAINGPAGNPECVWLGRRVVQLMYRDDLDTAFRHLDLYDRFGCPGGHVQAAFRCLTRFLPQIDDKVANSLNNRIHACWINPNAQPQAAAAPAPAATAGSAAAAPAATPAPAPATK
ncbi:MAG: beta-1-3, beta-1-6-glucan biosynthesis protein [Bradyrhizobium sp.]|nr:beta-1-3, beta-1-6-glucan biosynthesis protein [Bradyrhizobium sp.]